MQSSIIGGGNLMKTAIRLAMIILVVILLILTITQFQNVFTANTDTTTDIQWSSNGEWIVFACENISLSNSRSHLYITRSDGNGIRRITSDQLIATQPSWSSDGEWIAFFSKNILYKIRPDGTGLEEITRLTTLVNIMSVDWSPTNDWIAFSSHGVAGGKIHRILSNGEEHSIILEGDNLYTSVIWSRDGDLLMYIIPPLSSANGVYIINNSGDRQDDFPNVKPIGKIGWSSDGTELLVNQFKNQLSRFSLTDNTLTTVDIDYFVGSPTWSPDAEQIAFVGTREDGGDWLQLYETKINDSEYKPTRLTDMTDCNVSSPQWFDFDIIPS
jgi:TolB protein